MARRSPTTPLDRLFGPRRARHLRRRLGWLLVGTGLTVLRPRPRVAPVALWLSTAVVTGVMAARI